MEVKTIILTSVLYLSPIDRDITYNYRTSALLGYPKGAFHLTVKAYWNVPVRPCNCWCHTSRPWRHKDALTRI